MERGVLENGESKEMGEVQRKIKHNTIFQKYIDGLNRLI